MLIDWFTVCAQALNFLVLAWLLKRFLYKPILDAIDAREAGIAKQIADADAKEASAVKERDAFQQKNAEFDRQRAAMLTKASDEARAECRRLLDEARQAADALRAKRQDALESEQQGLADAIAQRTCKEVFAIARKLLADLAGTTLEERISEIFVHRLHELAGGEKAALVKAAKASSAPVLVRSAFDLSLDQQDAIRQVFKELGAGEIATSFETAPDMVAGIELSVGGQKVAWSMASYLGALENSVADLAKQREKVQGQSEAAAPAVPGSAK